MPKFPLTLLMALSLLMVSAAAIAQVRFPSVFLGQDTIPEVTDLPYFPKNTFVVVQYCDERQKCIITKFYVDKLNKEGVNITFFAVLDRKSEASRSFSDHFFHQTTIDWGWHISNELASQTYVLNADRKVVYQGNLGEIRKELFTAVEKEEFSPEDFAEMAKRQADEHTLIKGTWLYKDQLYPINLTTMDLLKATVLGRRVLLNGVASNKQLVNTDFEQGKVVPSLLKEVGLTIEAQKETDCSIKVNLESPLDLTAATEGSTPWKEVIERVARSGIPVDNYQEVINRLGDTTTKPIVTNVLFSEIIDQLQERGLRFETVEGSAFEVLVVE